MSGNISAGRLSSNIWACQRAALPPASVLQVVTVSGLSLYTRQTCETANCCPPLARAAQHPDSNIVTAVLLACGQARAPRGFPALLLRFASVNQRLILFIRLAANVARARTLIWP